MNNEDARCDIDLLAKLLKADNSTKNALFREERDAFYQVLTHEFSDALNNSSIKQSEIIFADIEKIADGLGVFSYIPELLGKTLVGVFGFNKPLLKKGLTALVGDESMEVALQDTTLPCLFLNDFVESSVFTDTCHNVGINKKEYYRTNKVLFRHNIDIRNFLQMFSVKSKASFHHIGIIYFPQHVRMGDSFNQIMGSKLDACVVLASTTDSLMKNRRWPSVKRFIQHYNLPCHIVVESINKESDKESEVFSFETYTESGLHSIFEQYNIPRYNSRFLDAVELSFVKIRKFYDEQLSEIAETQKMLVSDLTCITQENTKMTVQELSAQTLNQKKNLENEQKRLNAAIGELRKCAQDYEDVLNAKAYLSRQGETITECKKTLDTWSELFLALLEIRDYSTARNYLKKIKKSGYYLEYIYEMLLQSARGKTVNAYALDRLRNERDTEFVRRSKILLKRELGFAEIDYMRIARDIKHLRTADEYYYRGLWEENNNKDLKRAIGYYQEALDLDSVEAGKKLMELAGKTSKVSLQILADAMIPEANYALGMKARKTGKYDESNFYLKMAATKDHIPSIKLLTDDIYFRVKKQYYNKQKKLPKKDQEVANNAIMLYKFIIDHEANQIECTEQIGNLYHFLGDNHRAKNYWEKCQTPTSFYSLGRLYQYRGGVFGQDLDKAKAYFKKASDLGHSEAGNEYSKVLKMIDNNKKQEEKIAVQNLASRREVSPTTTESSGCFITSAVCTALQKPDDCEELMTLRAYRDNIKSSGLDISMLIAEYYRVAPLIVSCIDEDAQASEIYRNLWNNEISETYRLVKEGKYYEATLCYVKMTVNLCNKYGVELLPEIRNYIGFNYPNLV